MDSAIDFGQAARRWGSRPGRSSPAGGSVVDQQEVGERIGEGSAAGRRSVFTAREP